MEVRDLARKREAWERDMDSAMRDMDQLRERGDEDSGRKVTMLMIAAAVGATALFAAGMLVGGSDGKAPAAEIDPLAALAKPASASAQAPAIETSAPRDVEVRADSLMFPKALTEPADPAAATVRLAEAEAAALAATAPAALPVPQLAPESVPAPTIAPIIAPIAAQTPLSAAEEAAGSAERLTRVARHDPLMAAAMPTTQAAPKVLPGHDGEFTLQVVSYDSPEPAERFASSLRSRSHQAFVMRADVPGRGVHYRVRIGPFKSQAEAQSYRAQFESAERMHTLVVRNKPE